MEDWQKLNEKSLPEKDFSRYLNMEDITDADYMHAKRVYKDFEIKILGKYDSLYVQNDTLLLADLFENFWNMCLEIYEFGLAPFLTAPGQAWQEALLTVIEMLLIVEKGIRGGIS